MSLTSEMKSSAYKTKKRLGLVGKGHPCCNYHTCLCQIAYSLKMNQGKDVPIREWIRIGDYVSLKRIFFPLAFIIGDSQSQDKMCGRYLAYANVARMCQACDVSPEDSDDPYHSCNFISMDEVNDLCLTALKLYKPEEYGVGDELDSFDEDEIQEAKLEAHENLRLLSQHMHLNAFKDIWMGSNT